MGEGAFPNFRSITSLVFLTDHPLLMILLAKLFIEFTLLIRSNSIPCSRESMRQRILSSTVTPRMTGVHWGQTQLKKLRRLLGQGSLPNDATRTVPVFTFYEFHEVAGYRGPGIRGRPWQRTSFKFLTTINPAERFEL